MDMIKQTEPYKSYLLRLWQVEKNGEQVWRASLQSAQTSKLHLFADFESMVAFLRRETGIDQPVPPECVKSNA